MIVIVDEREAVADGYASWFDREGVPASGIAPSEFGNWIQSASNRDLEAIDAIVLGNFTDRQAVSNMIKRRTRVAIIAVNDDRSLSETLELFAAGVDDVVRKPIHVREILARIAAIKRRTHAEAEQEFVGDLRVFFDGRDPEVGGVVLRLPRRERRILEFLVGNRGRRSTKTQIFNAVYGMFNDDVDENIIESHISKLRKRLRQKLGRDPIDSQRYLGYRLV